MWIGQVPNVTWLWRLRQNQIKLAKRSLVQGAANGRIEPKLPGCWNVANVCNNIPADNHFVRCYVDVMKKEDLSQTGGCMCGAVRYKASAEPYYVAVCSCTFCQRLTGSDYNVESMFREHQFCITQGETKVFTYISDGSGQPVRIHFCVDCGTYLYLRPDRFPDCVGVLSGSFDDPNWFHRDPKTVGYFFTSEAPRGMMMPAGFDTYSGHAKALDGTMNEAKRHSNPFLVK